ncbi:MAG: cupin domain-containing protein [Candidatus Nitrotoga sp.]
MKNNIPKSQALSILGGLSATNFLSDYWQKKPLLIRQAIPNFTGLLDPQQLMNLATDENVQARLVTQQRDTWQLHHGPFDTTQFSRLGKRKWTVLVQGINHHLATGTALLQQFNFIPHARLDDLMVSFAPQGGGVGPHFDSYDVFLLQGSGHRRWQISAQKDRTLVQGAPLKILQRFKPEQEWILSPGDMLYLPPNYAHHGVAEDDCMTYSIGFRAPTYQELAEQFLVYMQDRINLAGMLTDPDLQPQIHPSEISIAMLEKIESIIRQIQWGKGDITHFVGCYLSEPKPDIFFDPPIRPLSRQRFIQRVQKRGLGLDLKSKMLCHDYTVFINGIARPVNHASYAMLRQLADERVINHGIGCPAEAMELLYQSYLDGYLQPA